MAAAAASRQEQLENLVAEVASYNASSRTIVPLRRVGVFKEPYIHGTTVPKDPNRFPLNVVNSDYSPIVVPDTAEVQAHLHKFKESNFVDTSTHTRFSLHPPDGSGKPDLIYASLHGPVRYKGTLDSATPNRLPNEITGSKNPRLIYITKEKLVKNRGPGDIPWDSCPHGQGLGTYINLTSASPGLAPAKDPDRASQPFAACERPDPISASRTEGSGLLYGPTLPDFAVWHRKGFACTSQLRNIKAETWGASTREPRDPKAIPPQKHVPAFDKRGFPADVSRQAELPVAWGTEVTCKRPSTSCTASAAIHQKNVPQRAKTADDGVSRPGAKAMRNHKKVVSTTKMAFHKTYGRQGTLKLDRQMGREDRSGLRADVGLSYDDAGAMGPGTHEPSVDYHNLHRIRAQTAPVASSWSAQTLQPLVRAQAVFQVRRARKEYLEQQRSDHMKALSAASRNRVCSKREDMHGCHGALRELYREECTARVAIIAR